MNSNFIDHIRIFCKSGKGGAGSTHFRREKFVPHGGPDGGDGGRGGHIIIKANKQLWTLLHLRYKKHIMATDGMNGGGQNSSGASGEDRIIEVPLGTVVKNSETGEVIFEITEENDEKILLKGGRGGQGNTHYKTSTNQVPLHSQPGEPSIEDWFIFELKILADVGLVGYPNAGKSTLLSAISAAKPKIANYPFTTLVPQLGIVSYHDGQSFCMADIPGIIDGAAEGKGLGHRFLRHIERNSILLFVVSIESDSIAEEYKVLLNELQKYNPELMDKHRILGVSKCDLADEELIEMVKAEVPEDIEVVFFSSVTQYNIPQLKDAIWNKFKVED